MVIYPLKMVIYPLKMVIFHSYVSHYQRLIVVIHHYLLYSGWFIDVYWAHQSSWMIFG